MRKYVLLVFVPFFVWACAQAVNQQGQVDPSRILSNALSAYERVVDLGTAYIEADLITGEDADRIVAIAEDTYDGFVEARLLLETYREVGGSLNNWDVSVDLLLDTLARLSTIYVRHQLEA